MTTNGMEGLNNIWRSLNSDCHANEWQVLKLLECPMGMVLGGRRFPENSEAVIFVFSSCSLDKSVFPNGKGFDIVPWVNVSSYPGFGIAIVRKQGGSTEIFKKMAEDLLNLFSVQTNLTDSENAKLLLDRIQAWQKFMQYSSDNRLSGEKERGLWGELCFLRLLLKNGFSPDVVARGWQGPLGGLHDFVFDGFHVEVKTTSNDNGFVINVDNLEQLSCSSESSLFLSAQWIEQTPTGETLPQLTDNILEDCRLSAQTVAVINSTLLQSGYSHEDRDFYQNQYRLKSMKLFPITNDFPTLNRQNVPQTVVSARYLLDIFRITLIPVTLNELPERNIQ